MSNPSHGPVLVITLPSGNVAQRVDSYAAVHALAAALKGLMEPVRYASAEWVVVPDSDVRMAAA